MPAENATYINGWPYDTEAKIHRALTAGFALLWQLAENDVDKRRAFLAVPTKNQLDGYINPQLPEVARTRLRTKGKVTVGDVQFPGVELELHLMTVQNKIPNINCPILAIHPTPKLLERIHAKHGVPDLIVVPWIQDDIAAWIEQQGPEELVLPPEEPAAG